MVAEIKRVSFESQLVEAERLQRSREYNLAYLRYLELEERFNQVRDTLINSGIEAEVSISLTGARNPEFNKFFLGKSSDVDLRLEWKRTGDRENERRAIGIVISDRKIGSYREGGALSKLAMGRSDRNDGWDTESWEFTDHLNLLFSEPLNDVQE